MPLNGTIYSVNFSSSKHWEEQFSLFVDELKKAGDSRFIYDGSLAGDIHKLILNGGITCSPMNDLDLYFQVMPLANVIKVAGGAAMIGSFSNDFQEVYHTKVEDTKQKASAFFGSQREIKKLLSYK